MQFSKSCIFTLILFSSLFFSACIKDAYPAKGVLVGYDPRDCACCGGYYVNLDNNNTVNLNTKVAGTLPVDFTFDASEFPLKVQFAYENGSCPSNNIIITKIRMR